MTEFKEMTFNEYLEDQHNEGAHNRTGGCYINTDLGDSCLKSDSSTNSSGSWSIDDSIDLLQASHKPLFDELTTFSIQTTTPSRHPSSPTNNETISLFNLSISPISSIEDLSSTADYTTNEIIAGDRTLVSETIASGYDEDERISLEDLTAQINSPSHRSNKRLNLETIFEDVFLETPKKRRFNGLKRLNSWRIETFQKITNDERINSYVIEQQKHRNGEDEFADTANILCNAFDNKININ